MMPQSFTLRLRGALRQFSRPAVMTIINATPDSFYAGSRRQSALDVARATERALSEGCDMIDLGAYSSRQGADDVTPAEETARLTAAMKAIREVDREVAVSVDTFRAEVARAAVERMDADMINDISGGDLDPDMFATVAALGVPYVVMHMRGTPATMQSLTDYSATPGGVTGAVVAGLSGKIARLQLAGVADIVADPGFGFSKTLEQNWQLMRDLPEMARLLGRPLLVGISRKSMLRRPLGITPDEALEATTVANTLALAGGAAILRVHDTLAARQAVDLMEQFRAAERQ